MKIPASLNRQFAEVVLLIKKARLNALRSVNSELIKLYWDIGNFISDRVAEEKWGKGVVLQLAAHLKTSLPDSTGYSAQNLWRMKQFFETYRKHPKLSTLLRELSWSCHLHILSKSKTIEEKEFYIRLAIKEKYSVRELERQIDSGYYERALLSKKKVPPVVAQIQHNAVDVFRDTYVLDFLNLPEPHSESNLQKSIVTHLKEFILEFGKDFAFIGQEYRLQVGNNDYFIDLLFFHRELQCLVMIELKIDDFKPRRFNS